MGNIERLQNNVGRTLLLAFFQVFLVIMPIAVPFFQSKGLSMQEVFSLQALFAMVVLLAAAAAIRGRRLSSSALIWIPSLLADALTVFMGCLPDWKSCAA